MYVYIYYYLLIVVFNSGPDSPRTPPKSDVNGRDWWPGPPKNSPTGGRKIPEGGKHCL